MIRINLVPQEILDREQQRQRNTQLIIGAGVIIACMLGITVMRLHKLHQADKELLAVTTEYNVKWADIGSRLEAKNAAVNALRTRLGVITDLLAGRSVYPHFMTDMAQAMPADVWVTGINTTRDPNSLRVSAQALSASAPGVTRWVRTLEKPGIFGNFGNPTISAINAADNSTTGGKQYSFSISFVYTPRP